MNFKQHVLHKILPAKSGHDYNLRSRPQNLFLSYNMDRRNFVLRMALKDTGLLTHRIVFSSIYSAHCQRLTFMSVFSIKRIQMNE